MRRHGVAAASELSLGPMVVGSGPTVGGAGFGVGAAGPSGGDVAVDTSWQKRRNRLRRAGLF